MTFFFCCAFPIAHDTHDTHVCCFDLNSPFNVFMTLLSHYLLYLLEVRQLCRFHMSRWCLTMPIKMSSTDGCSLQYWTVVPLPHFLVVVENRCYFTNRLQVYRVVVVSYLPYLHGTRLLPSMEEFYFCFDDSLSCGMHSNPIRKLLANVFVWNKYCFGGTVFLVRHILFFIIILFEESAWRPLCFLFG
jgi:hypothetical protein